MTTFTELGLDPGLLKALESEGYATPTPIQAKAIPSVLAGRDLLGIAQTGTGKTAAFALPILHRLAADRRTPLRRGTRTLILSPTRELASQIADSFRTYGRHMGLKVAVVFGGVGMRPQVQALAAGVDILVATPGRLIDHMQERTLVLDGTEILVLDEADQMMDLGFIRPLRQIIARLPARRQSLFFSATMPHEIGALAAELLVDPVKVEVAPVAKTADRVTQQVIFVEQTKKRAMLVELLSDPSMSRTLVFTRTKRGADRVARHLEAAGIAVAAIHGNKSQGQREQALAAFKAARIRALVATDIAARGIDVEAVSHVVNFELPNIPESYVHRIGRTARAGADGIAISLVDGEERAYLRDIERLTRQSIPSADRRGDQTLAGDEPQARGREQSRHRHDGSSRRPGGHGSSEARRPAHAGAAHERREHRADRPPVANGHGSGKGAAHRQASHPARAADTRGRSPGSHPAKGVDRPNHHERPAQPGHGGQFQTRNGVAGEGPGLAGVRFLNGHRGPAHGSKPPARGPQRTGDRGGAGKHADRNAGGRPGQRTSGR